MDQNIVKDQADHGSESRVSLSFKLNHILELEMSECEMLGELRGLLAEHPLVKLHPNYVFVSKGRRLKEYEPLSAQVPAEDANVSISLELAEFNERTASEHILECCGLFLAPHKYLSEAHMDFSIAMGKHDAIADCIDQQDVSRLPGVVDGYEKTDLGVLCKTRFNGEELPEEGLFRKLAYSEHNPAEPGCGNLGDLFYLDLVDRHGKYSCVTVNTRGLYRNESTAAAFSERPSTRAYLSLLELLCDLSADFATDLAAWIDVKENFQLHKTAQTDFYGDFKGDWLKAPLPSSPRQHSLMNIRARLSTQVHGKSTTMYRDWVEEFHNCRSLPATDTLQQVHKIKVLRRTHSDFTDAAEELAKAVVAQRLLPLNPNENRVESCYVFNNLFATYALDKTDWELPKSETAPTTYSAVNADIRNLHQILDGDIKDVNVINTAAVDYLGCRVIVQSVVQGILHFDQKTWNCYGSIDDGKTINFDADFHQIMERLADYFYLTKTNKYLDAEGKEYHLHGSPEVKGIKAGDNRKYVMDLMRLSPRDANFSDPIKHEGCLVRPELIANYMFFANFENNMNRQKEEAKPQAEEKTEGEVQETKEQVEQPEQTEPVEQDDKVDFGKALVHFNPSLLTQIQSSNEKQDEQVQELQKVGDFLVKQMIPTFLNSLVNGSANTPLDVAALTDSMHKLGINVRYIGQVYAALHKKAYPHLAKLMERFVLVRSLKKVLRRMALEEDAQTFAECVAQCLNIMLGNDLVRSMVDEKIKTSGAKKSPETKRKKKNKKRNLETKSLTEVSANLKVTSAELLDEVRIIASTRYNFPAELLAGFNSVSCLQTDSDKLAFLREICLCFGISLRAKEYDFKPDQRHLEYPIKSRDILGFHPRVKAAEFQIEGLKYNYKNAEHELAKKNLERAQQLYRGCQQLIVSAYGVLNTDFIYVTNKLATIAFLTQDIERAIKTQLYAVKVCEKVHGPNHPTTALNILELSNYLYEKKLLAQAIALHTRALKIFDLAGSSLNPNSLLCLHELQLMTEEVRDYGASCAVMQELLNRNAALFGDTDERLLFSLSKLAHLRAETGDFKNASLLQARHIFILKQLLKNTEEPLSEKYKEAFTKKLEESERIKTYFVSKSKLGTDARNGH